jgi:hypothetical protein
MYMRLLFSLVVVDMWRWMSLDSINLFGSVGGRGFCCKVVIKFDFTIHSTMHQARDKKQQQWTTQEEDAARIMVLRLCLLLLFHVFLLFSFRPHTERLFSFSQVHTKLPIKGRRDRAKQTEAVWQKQWETKRRGPVDLFVACVAAHAFGCVDSSDRESGRPNGGVGFAETQWVPVQREPSATMAFFPMQNPHMSRCAFALLRGPCREEKRKKGSFDIIQRTTWSVQVRDLSNNRVSLICP